jgi:hypothetical protein
MAIITIKDKDGNLIDIPAIKGDKGDSVDVQINGTSIVENGIANIPMASKNNLGIVKTNDNFGIRTNTSGEIYVFSDKSFINNRKSYQPLAIGVLDYAVKAALTDGKGESYTQEEKASARDRLGIDLKPLLETPIVIEENLVGAMNIELPTPCEKVLMLIKQPIDTTSITLYSGIFFEGQQGTGAGSLLGSVTTVAGKYIAYEMTVLINGIVECTSINNSNVKYDQTVLNQYTDYIDKKIAKVGLSSISATLPKGTEIMVLGR